MVPIFGYTSMSQTPRSMATTHWITFATGRVARSYSSVRRMRNSALHAHENRLAISHHSVVCIIEIPCICMGLHTCAIVSLMCATGDGAILTHTIGEVD